MTLELGIRTLAIVAATAATVLTGCAPTRAADGADSAIAHVDSSAATVALPTASPVMVTAPLDSPAIVAPAHRHGHAAAASRTTQAGAPTSGRIIGRDSAVTWKKGQPVRTFPVVPPAASARP